MRATAAAAVPGDNAAGRGVGRPTGAGGAGRGGRARAQPACGVGVWRRDCGGGAGGEPPHIWHCVGGAAVGVRCARGHTGSGRGRRKRSCGKPGGRYSPYEQRRTPHGAGLVSSRTQLPSSGAVGTQDRPTSRQTPRQPAYPPNRLRTRRPCRRRRCLRNATAGGRAGVSGGVPHSLLSIIPRRFARLPLSSHCRQHCPQHHRQLPQNRRSCPAARSVAGGRARNAAVAHRDGHGRGAAAGAYRGYRGTIPASSTPTPPTHSDDGCDARTATRATVPTGSALPPARRPRPPPRPHLRLPAVRTSARAGYTGTATPWPFTDAPHSAPHRSPPRPPPHSCPAFLSSIHPSCPPPPPPPFHQHLYHTTLLKTTPRKPPPRSPPTAAPAPAAAQRR